MRPLSVCLAIPDFSRLGAQRVAVWLAKGFDRNRVHPFFLVHKADGPMRQDLPADVPVVEVDPLCLRIPKLMSLCRLWGYREALRQHPPDVALGIVQYPSFALAWARRQLRATWPILACEHSFVTRNLEDPEAYRPLFRWYYRRHFPRLYNGDCGFVVTLTREGEADLVHHGVQPEKLRVIPNPIDFEAIERAVEEPLGDNFLDDGRPVVLGAGRLAWQKGFSYLLRAFSQVHAARPDAKLLILGEGPLRGKLQREINQLGLEGVVHMPGASDRIWAYMKRSSVFALSSEWEGLPMVMLEALALKLPIVSFACPSGPREILDEGRGGWLVPAGDTAGLSNAIVEALNRPDLARAKAEHAYRTRERYAVSTVCEQYTRLCEDAMAASTTSNGAQARS
jgi:glycosyltransferase involved in cell wall biosynthesis